PGNSCWWPRAESNHRHADFQSAALPTELLGREPAIISTHSVATFAVLVSRHRAAAPSAALQLRPPRGSGRVPLVSRQIDPELLQLAIEMRALQARLLGDPGHAAVLLREVELEIALLERIASLAQRPVEIEALLGLRAEHDGSDLLH